MNINITLEKQCKIQLFNYLKAKFNQMLENAEPASLQYKIDLFLHEIKVMTSPWGVMRIMGVKFGYQVANMPMIGLVKTEIKEGSGFR